MKMIAKIKKRELPAPIARNLEKEWVVLDKNLVYTNINY